jgi:hypothetical protein
MGSLRLFLLAEVISSIIWKTVDLSIRMILSFLRSSAEQPVTNISNPEGQSLVCETEIGIPWNDVTFIIQSFVDGANIEHSSVAISGRDYISDDYPSGHSLAARSIPWSDARTDVNTIFCTPHSLRMATTVAAVPPVAIMGSTTKATSTNPEALGDGSLL